MHEFLNKIQDENVDLKQIGIEGTTKEKIISELEFVYVMK